MSNFGLNLRQLRKQNKVSQKELGDLLGLGQTTITNYEKGNRYPSLEVLKQMADYFETSVDFLLGRTEEEVLNSGEPVSDMEVEPIPNIQQKQQEILNYLLDGDEASASRSILELCTSAMRIVLVFETLITPVMYQVGELWANGTIGIATEHYISGVMSKIISRASERLPVNEHAPVAVCMSLSYEPHTLGILIISEYMKVLGYKPYNIGSNIPTTSLLDLLYEKKAKTLAISVTMAEHIDAVTNLIHVIRSRMSTRNMKIIVGGQAFSTVNHFLGNDETSDEMLWKLTGADGYCKDFQMLKDVLEKNLQ